MCFYPYVQKCPHKKSQKATGYDNRMLKNVTYFINSTILQPFDFLHLSGVYGEGSEIHFVRFGKVAMDDTYVINNPYVYPTWMESQYDGVVQLITISNKDQSCDRKK